MKQNKMSFRLWHLFLSTALVEIWIVLFSVSANAAIVVCVSLVPAAACVFALKYFGHVHYTHYRSVWTHVAVLCLVWFGLYVLSIGPALLVYAKLPPSIESSAEALIDTLYGPVGWLVDNTILSEPLIRYFELWS